MLNLFDDRLPVPGEVVCSNSSDLSPVPPVLYDPLHVLFSLVRSKSKTLARNIFIPLALFLC